MNVLPGHGASRIDVRRDRRLCDARAPVVRSVAEADTIGDANRNRDDDEREEREAVHECGEWMSAMLSSVRASSGRSIGFAR